jgi:hypothetical protein
MGLDEYRSAIECLLRDYASIPYAYGDIRSAVSFDRNHDQYLLITVGWDSGRRVHSCLIHIELIDGKVWIQRDGTEEGVAKELVRAGIAEDHIVLAFQSIERRRHSGFAVA